MCLKTIRELNFKESIIFGKNEIVGQKYFKDAPEDQLFVTSMFMTLQGEGPFRGEPAFFIRLAKCNLACSFCFVPSTPILMADGKTKRIDEVVIGDEVMSWDKESFVKKKVTNTFTSEASKILRVTAGNKKVWVTPEHPFLTSNRGWVKAEDLNTNDIIVNFTSSDRMKMFNPMFDEKNRRIMTKEQKKAAAKRLSNLWKDEEFRDNNIQRMKDNNPMKDPVVAYKSYVNRESNTKSGLEERFEKICEGLDISFVGDGSNLHIAHRIPDFVVNGQNKVIEIWAADTEWGQERIESDWQEKRKSLFEKHGYEVLFMPLMPQDLKIDNHSNIREQVSRFIHNGFKVKEVHEVTERAALVNLFGSKDAKKIVHNFEVEDTHTYIANSMVVHNCDTFFDDGDWLTFTEIEERIEQTIDKFYADKNMERPDWTKHNAEFDTHKKMVLVLTGGEPTLQKNIKPFLYLMNNIFQKTQIESNGIVFQSLPFDTTLVISPKCAEKNGVATKYLKPHKDNLESADCLKFVMSADQDSPYCDIPNWAHEWAARTRGQIFISPMNVYNDEPQKSKELRSEKNKIEIEERSTVDEVISFWTEGLLNMEENQKNHEYAAEFCVKHGYILNLQIHLYASLA